MKLTKTFTYYNQHFWTYLDVNKIDLESVTMLSGFPLPGKIRLQS